MRVLFDIGHPAHIHLFKNVIKNLEKGGHAVKVTARNKEITKDLLDAYGIPYENRGEAYNGLFKKAIGMIKIDLELYNIAKKFDPDILAGVHNPYIAHVAKIMKKPSIIFNDTENVKIAKILTYPFATVICTPSCFKEQVDPGKHVKINGYKELAYLHPENFVPDPDVLKSIGVLENERYIVLRFISWAASHDIGLQGIERGKELEFIKTLEEFGKVFVTSERELGSELDKYRLHISPEKMHSLLYYAQLYIGEGGTMAAEAAVLGTPSIHIESTSSGRPTGEFIGNFSELQNRYDIMYFFARSDEALKKGVEILKNENSKDEWQIKRDVLIKDKINVAEWMTYFIEHYPDSFHECGGLI
ncbi:DUF354 domain-containing protein [Methanoplanus sp. FWC-SCC4]|uniref:DUF354 domain-containing protein n=1 Tax=Methanochimaera problematica TaxID=2609417 RepID=A0AA97I2J9_9EURY|nr:DUF354 domain-containing protein [Methanoplanus sp. FWC-SCC4]WOF16350.1 DUF354 domain-containing protein [Methanoplanus sp. FWC-SCC4]